MIGDPSGKSQERNLLDERTLRHNQEAIKRQLAKLLDFDSDAPNAARMVNNYDWMKDFTFLDFIRDIGKCITVNYMMAKDSVKKRFNGEGDGMSFTEFTYQPRAGLRLPAPLPDDGLQDPARRRRPVGQHHHRHGADPPQAGPRSRSLRHHLPAHHQGRRHEVRQDRERQRLARPALHVALQVLPVLAQRERRGRQTLHQDLHAARPGKRSARSSPSTTPPRTCACCRSAWRRRSPR